MLSVIVKGAWVFEIKHGINGASTGYMVSSWVEETEGPKIKSVIGEKILVIGSVTTVIVSEIHIFT